MDGGRIRIFTRGLWRLRDEIAGMTGMTPVWHGKADAAAGWGHKATARWPKLYGRWRGVPYIAFEDGFLRAVRPGPAMRPAALVLDRSGIYYDARQACDLETILETGAFTGGELAQARDAIDAITRLRLSKYNHVPDRAVEGLKPGYILVLDQSFGDQSVAGALGSEAAFAAMLAEARERCGAREVVAKVHPDALSGGGYIARLARDPGIRVVADAVNPWRLIDGASEVHTVSSQLGFEAVFGGKPVICHGVPFYAGWGLTEDRQKVARRNRRRSVEEVFAAAYLRYSRYFDLWTRQPVSLRESIDQLQFLRDAYLGNSRPMVALGITAWKRKPIAALFDGPAAPLTFAANEDKAIAEAKRRGAGIAAWGKTANAAAADIRKSGLDLVSVEDGFLRSAGLGASFTPSMSFSLDRTGIYYDSRRPSDLETMLETMDVPDAMIAEAKALRQLIVARGLTKYNVGAAAPAFAAPAGAAKVLVAGQVANDEAVRLAAPASYLAEDMARGGANLALLKAARRRNPKAFLIYKPHPDVETVGRRGAIPAELALQFADAVAEGQSMAALFDAADRFEVLSSLAGFEALLRGRPVTVHGQPFYAGWGLTEDLYPVARRTRRRNLDELVAITLLAYPRYFDPASGLPCPLRVVLGRLEEARKDKPAALRSRGGQALAQARHALLRALGRP